MSEVVPEGSAPYPTSPTSSGDTWRMGHGRF